MFQRIKKFLNKYVWYVTFEWVDKNNNAIRSWRIVETTYDLEVSENLAAFIKEFQKEHKDFFLLNFKRLK
jgi:hypothetical protein